MKNNFFMPVSASVKSHKLQIVFFCLFLVVSVLLINISVGIIFPLSGNLENKVNNHISNREVVTEFPADINEAELENTIEQIENIEHVVNVYQMPSAVSVTEQSGILKDRYQLGYIHWGYELLIASGRSFDEDEKNVALVPQSVSDFDATEGRIEEISGESLIGKELKFSDDFGNPHTFEVVGVYVSSDPIFSSKEILVPYGELMAYDKELINSADSFSDTSSKSYIVQTDSYKHTDGVLNEVQKLKTAYRQQSLIDSEMYYTALIVLIFSLLFFVFLVVLGFYIFLKSNVNDRTSELALYRALGYQSKHIFRILLFEYLLFGVISIIVGILLTLVINIAFVNPFLLNLVGNTLMEMEVQLSVLQELGIVVSFLIILLIVCNNAVKRSDKIDLTVLLREK